MAQEIVPRWEWRAFGDSFNGSPNPFSSFNPKGVQQSDETYFLSLASSENVKVRDALMDIKALQQVNADGLQQWKPVMKQGFPLPSAEVARIVAILRLPARQLQRSEFTLQQLLDEVMTPIPEVRVVNVHKTRTRYAVEGCMAEMAEVSADGKTTRTIALESEEARQVTATVQKLGVDKCGNTSYPQGLKQLLGMHG